jgi:folylpolyglutamate synthase/dihydrofolate synthase
VNYNQAEKYLYSFIDYEKIPGIAYASHDYNLGHVEELLHRVGNPHLAAKTIHIAGTKGKGSVAAMIAEVLRASGYRTGLYTSPHLHDLRERIKVDGSLIPQTEFAALMAELKPCIESMRQELTNRQLTFFEVLTVLAFAYFKKKQVDFQVLEVGLGGRLDATNVAKPEVCVITPISLDHTEVLGDSLAKIAYEKAGIIKPGCRVVLSPQPEEITSIIGDACHKQGAKLVQVGKDITWRKLNADFSHQSFVVAGQMTNHNVTMPLLGDYQVENAATAVAALEVLASLGWDVSAGNIAQGLARVEWPGRFQILQRCPVVLVDGAHNEQAMKRLVESIQGYFNYDKFFLILGASCDKNISGMVKELVSLSPQVIVTHSLHPRAASPSTTASEFIKWNIKPKVTDSVSQALSQALSLTDTTDLICVTGSLFVVAEALDYFSEG